MKHVNLTLPDELHKRLKVVCALEENMMTMIIRQLVEQYVEKAERKLKNNPHGTCLEACSDPTKP